MRPIFIHSSIYQHLHHMMQDLEVYHKADQDFWTGSEFIAHPRFGEQKIWNFKSDLDFACRPSLDQTQKKTFAEITDSRSGEILDIMKTTGKRLAVFWSGGIDSTVVLSAIVKNFPPSYLQMIDVYMNNHSFMEYPLYYNRVIKHHKLNCINIENLSSHQLPTLFAEKIVTDGEPADKLWLVKVGISYFQEYGFQAMHESLNQGHDRFIKFLCFYMDEDQAHHYWNFVIDNIFETQAPVETIADLFWWINYNYHWNGHLLIWYAKHLDKNNTAWMNYQLNYHPWYNSLDYQTWSFSDNAKLRLLFTNPSEYKMEAKTYIFDLLKDENFIRYKTKHASGHRGDSSYRGLVIFEDGSAINHASELGNFVRENCLLSR